MSKKSKIKLRPGASIGEPAAEDDHRFLADCFVNHPTVDALKEVSSPQCVLLGRTGAGKSAILWHLESTLENVTRLDPREMAFQYLGNSAIIQQIATLGVNLHTLFEYLWTHTLTLHICRECLGANTQQGLNGVLEKIKGAIWRDPKRETAVNYLEKHGSNFWLDVEKVSTEITNSISEKLAAEAGLSADALKLRMEAGYDWRDEQKRLFKYRAQEIVSSLQMRELKETLNALADCLDSKRAHYILIDDLDTGWAGGEETQYALIRALIETLKTFRRLPTVKIIVAMREDLYESTLRTTTDKHFQAEKLEGVIKRIRWSDALLLQLVDRRIQQLFRFNYTTQMVGLADILATQVVRIATTKYILDRTLRRPRDIIAFVNKILAENEGQNLPLAGSAITRTEPLYSADRLRALEDEWRSCHPLIGTYLRSLHQIDNPSKVEDLNEDRLLNLVFEVADLERKPCDDVEKIARTVYERDKQIRFKKLSKALMLCLYKIGAVGIKLNAQGYVFSYEQNGINDADVTDTTRFVVHPMLVPSLGCRTEKKNAA